MGLARPEANGGPPCDPGWQVESVHAGMALAHLFNRSIILPRLACYCDK